MRSRIAGVKGSRRSRRVHSPVCWIFLNGSCNASNAMYYIHVDQLSVIPPKWEGINNGKEIELSWAEQYIYGQPALVENFVNVNLVKLNSIQYYLNKFSKFCL